MNRAQGRQQKANKTKYARQFGRTYDNKLRRVRKSNGPEAAAAYRKDHAPKPVKA